MSSTSRFDLEPAPGGLSIVQDLVNTRPVAPYGVRDLLGTVADAQRWTRDVARSWQARTGTPAGVGRIASPDLTQLRRLRRDVERHLLRVEPVDVPSVRASLAVDADGVVRLRPVGSGARWISSAVWGEVLLAQHDGRWERLKVCRNPDCPCAFYDHSRNNSRVWHDVRTCGNVANLRASRARRKAAAS